MNFKDLGLDSTIVKAVAEENYKAPTKVQEEAIPHILAKKDIIVSAQTGTGKTAAFALPIIQLLLDDKKSDKDQKRIKALVISPTRELALQIEQNFKTYSRYTNLKTTVVYGGASIEPQKIALKKGVDILVATPGRLLDLHKQDAVHIDFVETLVLDEADMMLDMGFIDDVNKINRLCPEDKQSLLFSATIPDKIVELSLEVLKEPEKIDLNPNSTTSTNITQFLYNVHKKDKIELCLHLLRNTIKGRIIIFRRTKYGVDKLEKTLLKNNYRVASIHGDKTQIDRQKALEQFKHTHANILIATDVAARGIDIDDVDNVVNFDLPNVPETYVHRTGRTGRAGNTGQSYSFCSADEKMYIKKIKSLVESPITVVEDHPYPLDANAKPEVHKSKETGSKHKKGRKSAASKKKKKRWY